MWQEIRKDQGTAKHTKAIPTRKFGPGKFRERLLPFTPSFSFSHLVLKKNNNIISRQNQLWLESNPHNTLATKLEYKTPFRRFVVSVEHNIKMGLMKMEWYKTEYNYNLKVTVRVDCRVQWKAVVDMATNHRVQIRVASIISKTQMCEHTVPGLILL
jgi:hypothetical protein